MIDFIQIIYEDIQAEHCYPFAKLHRNETLTPYFENSIIKGIVEGHKGDQRNGNAILHTNEIISICSWRLAAKRGDMHRLKDKSLTIEKLTQTPYDVAVLTPRSPTHQPLHMASHWHGEPWDNAFKMFKQFLKTDLDIKVPDELKHSIYENHFAAKREIYYDYVHNYLTPAIEHMSKHQVYFEDAGYAKRKTQAERDAVKRNLGREDYPIAPFILERLFSIFVEGRNYNIVPL
jgi:hypothetical protein